MAVRFEGALKEWVEFIPEWKGERDKFSEDELYEPVSMELKFLTKEDRDKLDDMSRGWKRKGIKEKKMTEKWLTYVFENHVQNIQNLDDQDDGTPIETGLDLYGSTLYTLIAEVSNALTDRSFLEEGLKKKLMSRSDTSSALRTQSRIGSAQSAIPKSQTTTTEEGLILELESNQTSSDLVTLTSGD